VLTWTNVRKSSQVQSQSLSINEADSLRVVLRITTKNGSQAWVASAPLEVRTQELPANPRSTKSESQKSEKYIVIPNKTATSICTPTTCDIDEANRCRAGSVSVREKLNAVWGPARWYPVSGADAIYRGD
jgi:hypothetical protein